MAYSPSKKRKIVEAVLKEYAQGKYSIKSICSYYGVDYKSFRKWEAEISQKAGGKQVEKPAGKPVENSTDENQAQGPGQTENSTAKNTPPGLTYEQAQEKRFEVHRGKLKELAQTALEKYLQPWEVEERRQEGVRTPDGTVVGTKMTVIKKIHMPPPMLVRFTLEALDSDNFKVRQEIHQTGESPFIELMKAVTLKTDTE